MKFMSPIVTESPMLMRKSRLPYASPSKSTPRKLVIMCLASSGSPGTVRARDASPGFASAHPGLRTSASLAGVLLVGELVELDVVETPAGLLDLADIHGLHDVARFRIDRDRPARAVELHPLHRSDQLVAVG